MTTDSLTALADGYADDGYNYPGLLAQLRERARDPLASRKASNGSNPNKSVSAPPVNQAMLDLVDSVDEQATRLLDWASQRVILVHEQHMNTPESKLRALRSISRVDLMLEGEIAIIQQSADRMAEQCRVMLGHSARTVTLAGTVCHECDGALTVAEDASTPVLCGSCGVEYPHDDWIAIAQRRISGPEAIRMIQEARGTERPAARAYLGYLANKGKITNYGGSKKGQALYDKGELADALKIGGE